MKLSNTTIVVFIYCASATAIAYAELPRPASPLWRPVRDDVFLQEVGQQVKTQAPLTAVAVRGKDVFVASAKGVLRLADGRLSPAGGPKSAVALLKVLGGHLWAATATALWRHDGVDWAQVAEGKFVDVCLHLGKVIAITPDAMFRHNAGTLERIAVGKLREPMLGVASYAETVYVRHARRLGVLRDRRLEYDDVADWGQLPWGASTRDLMAFGSRLLVATDRGLGVLRGSAWTAVRGRDGLCYEDTTCLARGFTNDYWVGTTSGAIRVVGEKYHYFGHARWLPHGKVNAIACSSNTVYLATDGGVGIIHYEPYTLLKKAAYYERWLEEWGQKRLGFTHKLFWNAELGEWLREVSDNDVGFTSHYLDALCFQYAVTGDEKVRAAAVNVFKSVKWSEEITSIRGFPARSIWAVGERGIKAQHGSGGLPAEWHKTSDGKWEWKGDTSSDEVDAHFHSVTLFYELVARGREKDWAKEHLHRIMSHIIDSGWVLRDVDGKPTRWGRWDPAYLQRPYGYYARGLNGLEALNYVTTALSLTGDTRFAAGKRQLLDWGYHREALRQKLTFPPEDVTFFDDRLAFYSYTPLLRYEKDAALRSIYRRSLERSWEIKRIERLPWFNFLYGAATGNDCELEPAVEHLREWPLDCVSYSYTNSHRHDLFVPRGYKNYSEGVRPVSARECGPQRWDRNFLRLDGGAGGRAVNDPSGWLDAYWVGRYYGMITAPTTTDPELLTVPKLGRQHGAKPYAGPPRPPLEGERR